MYAGEFKVNFLCKDNGQRTKKKPIMIDLELPAAAKLSWWRLSGYDTRPNSDDEAAAGEDESKSESSDESGSEADDEYL